jgi:DnaJ-class molecular chaperone
MGKVVRTEQKPCTPCGGTGQVRQTVHKMTDCRRCNGNGYITETKEYTE